MPPTRSDYSQEMHTANPISNYASLSECGKAYGPREMETPLFYSIYYKCHYLDLYNMHHRSHTLFKD